LYNTTQGSGFPDDDIRRLLRLVVRAGGLLGPYECGGHQLSLSEVFALGELGESGTLSQQELGERLGLEKSTVSRLAANLERHGWLTRERDPANRRFYRLDLTAEGREFTREVGCSLQQTHTLLFEGLTPAEREGLAKGLTGLIRVLESHQS
jgi:DNA-binding MarR family transcriptional regulator